jgi:L-glyceraldehyde 3-phosphate reductase
MHPTRYDTMPFRRCGISGLALPAIGLGLWQNFGDDNPFSRVRAMVRRAFDLGITHFDLANNYGRPPGSAETTFGRILATDLKPYRNELIIASKAGYDMWPGPYGRGSTRKYLVASCDETLKRLRLEYVDLFYSHRFDPTTPIEETVEALNFLVTSGRALYVGVSSYSIEQTAAAVRMLEDLHTPCLAHQASYSMLNRWIEPELLEYLDASGVGCVAFSVLAQGVLNNKYSGRELPRPSRAATVGNTLTPAMIDTPLRQRLTTLAEIAASRGQNLSQLAIAWVLRSRRVSCALIGVRTVAQLEENLRALQNLTLSEAELRAIDAACGDLSFNLWRPTEAPVTRRPRI